MQAKFRFAEKDGRWRHGLEQRRRKANETKRAIRELINRIRE